MRVNRAGAKRKARSAPSSKPTHKAQVATVARAKPRERSASHRVPLTITLDADNLAFVESCVSLKEFNSVDKLFDAALACYRKYVHALNAYAEDQVHKGFSRAEVLESVEFETVVTKTL